MNETVVCIDVMNMLYRNWHALKNYTFQYPAIHGLLRDLRYIAQMIQSTNFVFCFDSDRSVRKVVFPDYKCYRLDSIDRKQVNQQRAILQTLILPKLGYLNLLCIDGAEADDLMGMLSKDSNHTLRLVTNDSDVYQLLDRERVKIWNPLSKFMLDEDYLLAQYDIHPHEWVALKSLTGCESDDIPGVPGVGMGRGTAFIRNRITAGSKILETIQQSGDIIERNRKLVTLPTPHLGEQKPLEVRSQPPIAEEVWNSVVARYGMENLCGKQPV